MSTLKLTTADQSSQTVKGSTTNQCSHMRCRTCGKKLHEISSEHDVRTQCPTPLEKKCSILLEEEG